MGCGASTNTRSASYEPPPQALQRKNTLKNLPPEEHRVTSFVTLDFEHIMQDIEGKNAIMKYARQEKTSQKRSLQLLEAIMKFKNTQENRADSTARKINANSIISTYLEEGATKRLHVPDPIVSEYKKPTAGAEYSLNMFNSVEQAVFAHLKNDSAGFEAFSKSSIAEELIRTRPHLAVNDMTTAFGDKQVQADLAELMSAAQQVANCERMTAWMVNNSEIFSVCAAGLENDMILRVPIGRGLAGCAASDQQDLIVEDAWEHPKFDKTFDEKTGYRTRSVLCVVLFREGQLRAVVQLLNKNGQNEEDVTIFTSEDAKLVREQVGPALLNAFEDVALKLK